jgi:hypothetical protein
MLVLAINMPVALFYILALYLALFFFYTKRTGPDKYLGKTTYLYITWLFKAIAARPWHVMFRVYLRPAESSFCL